MEFALIVPLYAIAALAIIALFGSTQARVRKLRKREEGRHRMWVARQPR
ncbi:MAG TPA: hypothetical protein VGR73_03230 [Bryobacteraceae bacterium]|nr:hypothetical protein [Bryobacteraceae bacterium]